jgi:transcriptional regulator with XRE-family HTH domain
MTRRSLADQSGVAKQATSNIETGAAFASLRTLEQFVEALRVPDHMITVQAERYGTDVDGALEANPIRVVRSINSASRSRARDLIRLIEDWSQNASGPQRPSPPQRPKH